MSNGFKPRGFEPRKPQHDNPFDDMDESPKSKKFSKSRRSSSPKGTPPNNSDNDDNRAKVSIKYKGSMSRGGWISLIICIVITVASLCFGGYAYEKYSLSKVVYNASIGTRVVNDLFNWGTVQVKDKTTGKTVTEADMNQVNKNMQDLKSIMTPQAYNNNTLENGTAVLGLTKTEGPQPLPVYLETGQHACRPNIVKQGPGYVIFTLVSPNIQPNRMFEISYQINKQGKIDWMLQAEIAPMMSYNNTEWA